MAEMRGSLLEVTAARFKALAHPARLRILAMLAPGELCVCQVTAVLGLAYSTVSAHLAELRGAGLIEERKDGRWVYYRLAAGGAEAVAMAISGIDGDPLIGVDRGNLERACCVPPAVLCDAGLDLDRATGTCRATPKEHAS